MPNRDGVTPLGAGINYPDLGRPDVQAAWGRQYAHLTQDLGIDMIWQDMMCPAAAVSADTPEATLPLNLMIHDGRDYVPHAVCHNAYPMFLLKATQAGISSLRPETRPFILARGGYAGLQRYAALWTGDNASSWDFLRISLPQVLNLGLSGVPISGFRRPAASRQARSPTVRRRLAPCATAGSSAASPIQSCSSAGCNSGSFLPA